MNKKTLVNPKLEKLANIQFKIHDITDNNIYDNVLNVVAPASLVGGIATIIANYNNLKDWVIDFDVQHSISPESFAGTAYYFILFVPIIFSFLDGFLGTVEESVENNRLTIAPSTQWVFYCVTKAILYTEGAVEYVVKLPVKLTAKAMVQHQMNKERKIKSLPNGQEIFENLVDAKENKQIAKQKKYEKKISLKEQKTSQKIINQTNKINQKTKEKMQKYM